MELSADDPIVQRLFQPWIPSDFEEEEEPSAGSGSPSPSANASPSPNTSGSPSPRPRAAGTTKAEELRWLRQHAVLFGLDPERDLQLPTSPATPAPPLDGRYAAQLEHVREIRAKKDQRRLEKELKQREQQLNKLKGKPKQLAQQLAQQQQANAHQNDDDEDQDNEDSSSTSSKKEYLPLTLRSRAEREAYGERKRATIQDLMEDMDERIAAWKLERRETRRERKRANQHQLGGQQYPNQK